MSRGSKAEAEAEVLQPDTTAVDEWKTEAPPEPGETRWVLGRWGELEQWRCALCPFDTLDGAIAIAAHWQAEHAPVPAPPAERIQIYDRFGNPIK